MTQHVAQRRMGGITRQRGPMLLILCLLASIATGCAHWIELTEVPNRTEPSNIIAIPSDERVPMVLNAVALSQNGAALGVPGEFERQVIDSLQDTNLFSQLLRSGYGQLPEGDKFVTGRLSVEATVEPHAGEAAWKGFVIGASMFLLSSVIPLEYEYASTMTLELERWDGATTQYTATSKGAAFYYLFGASPLLVEELKGQVTEVCLTDLIQQLVKDTTRYLASSAPLPDPTIRTIAVKAKSTVPRTRPVSTTIQTSPQ